MGNLNKSRIIILLFSVFTIILMASVPSFSKPEQTRPCDDCHAFPSTQIDVTVDRTSVTAYSNFNFSVTASYTGGANDGKVTTQIAWPDDAADNALFGFDPQYSIPSTSPAGSLTSTITAPTTPGTYTIRVYAACGSWDGTSKETDYENIVVTVKYLGDCDGDGDVDYDDFIILAGAYGSSSGQPAYDQRADFDGDGDVDYDDFIILAGNYGTSI